MRGEGIVPVMDVGNNGGGFGNGFSNDWAWVIILFLIFGGFGRNGFGGYGGGGGIGENYVLATDFATIERKLDSVNNGICDATFALNNSINNGLFGVQNSLTQGFSGLNTALLQGNYALSSQLADCCCGLKTQLADGLYGVSRGIDAINYNNVINTNAISKQISDCCCDLEKMNMQTRYDAQTYNCNTLQAIDKLGDRIIDRLTQDKLETLTAENQALRLAASQERQNNLLIERLDPNKCPVPAYVVNGPTPVNFPTNCCGTFTGYGCNNGCGNY